MADFNDLLLLLPGSKVVVSSCEAAEHVDTSPGCLCKLKGKIFVVDKLYESMFAGTPTWYLKGSDKRVRLSEITILAD